MSAVPLKPDDAHNKIHEAAKQLQKAVEGMGMKQVAIFYVYTNDKDEVHDGYCAKGIVHTVGACEYLKFGILNDLND